MRPFQTACFCLIALVFAPAEASPQHRENLEVAPGHQTVISASGVRRASVGDPAVADARVLSGVQQVIVTGKRIGTTDLYLWFKDGRKTVYGIQVSTGSRDLKGELSRLLGGMEGVELKRIGSRWILDGQVYRGTDLARIQRILKLYPQVQDLTHMNLEALKFLAGEIQRVLEDSGIRSIFVRPAGDQLFLEGTASGKSEASRAEKIVASYFPRISNQMTVGADLSRLILVDVKLTEVKTSSLGQVGLKWPAQVDATGLMTLTGAGTSGTVNVGQDAAISLQALVESGAAKILSNPKLLCKSGTPASFLAGGEIPIRLIGERTASIMFKEYGLQLEVSAEANAARQVFLSIEARISDLDQAPAVEGIPGILEHKVKTAVNLRFGDTVVLAGLMENRARKNVQKVPFLGHIPILGELFKSRAFQNSESEFLVFLTPLPGEPGYPADSQELRRMKKRLEKARGDLDLSILD
ncbi:MAG: pilus assembly protein N-terminal domain-containing protein [Pseudomonadota bacterium]